ncbi:hypothetical protein LWI28_011354 [Acer negundo]|uniref:Uncharacterized protein n=1 Tax=Acer negundo TaxID=4023 RepID=A0AAD5IEG2_ACENE|nr:hypothetical protein LWI28_011354 [Acer negundo]KAK4839125.1 hypothetical protein QYF36_019321 [Acer negundo]
MVDVFMFSAQTEPSNDEAAKKKPPDPAVSANHSRVCMMMSVTCLGNQSPNYGDVKSMQVLGSRKITGRVGGKATENGQRLLKGGKLVSKKSGESRFAILTDYVDEEAIAANTLAPSNKILSEISNQITLMKIKSFPLLTNL